jgi:hypothetical protein
MKDPIQEIDHQIKELRERIAELEMKKAALLQNSANIPKPCTQCTSFKLCYEIDKCKTCIEDYARRL